MRLVGYITLFFCVSELIYCGIQSEGEELTLQTAAGLLDSQDEIAAERKDNLDPRLR